MGTKLAASRQELLSNYQQSLQNELPSRELTEEEIFEADPRTVFIVEKVALHFRIIGVVGLTLIGRSFDFSKSNSDSIVTILTICAIVILIVRDLFYWRYFHLVIDRLAVDFTFKN